MEDSIKIDEKELYKQLEKEIMQEEHSIKVTVTVPNVNLEKIMESAVEPISPVINIEDSGGGTNAMTRAMLVTTLKEVISTILEDKPVKEALVLLEHITKTEKFSGGKNDTN